MSYCKVLLIGRLGQDPETRFLKTGTAVASFTVATNRVWKDKEGERKEETEWHTVKVFGRQGESCGQYLQKGREVFIEGRIHTEKWKDKSGNDKQRAIIIAENVRFIRGKQEKQEEAGGSKGQEAGGRDEPPDDDDVPY